jgi:hypothetical protein
MPYLICQPKKTLRWQGQTSRELNLLKIERKEEIVEIYQKKKY